MAREGILIDKTYKRITEEQIERIHQVSMEILSNPGLLSFNPQATEIFHSNGAEVTSTGTDENPSWHLKLPEKMVIDALNTAPKVVKLGARDPENALILDGDEPRVHFITGSETNIWLDANMVEYVRKDDSSQEIKLIEFTPRRGTVADLCKSAHVCEHLDTVDGYIRTVNIQDKDITETNKDVNKFFASLDNTTKHVMSGLTTLEQLDNVVNMAEIIAGGKQQLKDNPMISFITCLVKSPLQFTLDATNTLIEVCKRGLPVAVSSSPQAGTTAPIKEAGIMAQINAEVLAGITLSQLVNKGAPVLYGSVPVMARMDTLGDSYGSIETSQYNIDCVQMARHYRLPNYSTSGVCDAKIPGEQSTMERLFSNLAVTMSGPQFLHCAFGLLDCNAVFCLLQAVLDDANFNRIKYFLKPPALNDQNMDLVLEQIRNVSQTQQKLYIQYIRKVMRTGEISPSYPFEGNMEKDEVFALAYERMNDILNKPASHIDEATTNKLYDQIPGLLPRLNVYK